ncbi:hypothetical protein KUL42_03390 [Alteromonas sp. KUL42]|uniref:PaaX family transcriptional regulator n=1 Tax=Alteromonas sp. KUL42 TaxID=2480797 RepID=UPI0007936787|nr:PaaX family transcriptional regulator [Alteromonas sp. KUL42]KXJ62126.1 MAG: PaaX family transcriptional regulator [Alteromonas sp. Nap_26]GEA05578.1 hypothetical protein KUL42_03390 [Alteromonas sp. KUL42]
MKDKLNDTQGQKTKKPVARKLLLKLLSSRENIQMNAAAAVRVGALFGISENNIRVTLNRLHSAKLLNVVERGYYQLGPSGKQFADEISQWRFAEQHLVPWQSDWIVVQATMLSKSDKKQQRINDRALKLLGMKALSSGMYIRPNNMRGGAAYVRNKLQNLGLSEKVFVYRATDFDKTTHNSASALWRVKSLTASYQQGITSLTQSLQKIPALSLDDATKETFEIGDNALRNLVFDPLLPEPLIDVALRQQYRALVEQYDDVGAGIWNTFLNSTP